jgi:hypothetical protein
MLSVGQVVACGTDGRCRVRTTSAKVGRLLELCAKLRQQAAAAQTPGQAKGVVQMLLADVAPAVRAAREHLRWRQGDTKHSRFEAARKDAELVQVELRSALDAAATAADQIGMGDDVRSLLGRL